MSAAPPHLPADAASVAPPPPADVAIVSAGKVSTLVCMGFAAFPSVVALEATDGDVAAAVAALVAQGSATTDPFGDHVLRRRFELIGGWVMNGLFHLDGVHEGAARYRHTDREDWWILKKGGNWHGCGHGLCHRCTSVFVGIPADAKGRNVGGIEEIPDDPAIWGGITDYGPFTFRWVDDFQCGFTRAKTDK
jgi:hypothetical protein